MLLHFSKEKEMAAKKKPSPSIKDFYVVMTGIDPLVDLDGSDGSNMDMYVFDVKDPVNIDLDDFLEEDEVYVYKLTPLFKVKRKSTLEKISVDTE